MLSLQQDTPFGHEINQNKMGSRVSEAVGQRIHCPLPGFRGEKD